MDLDNIFSKEEWNSLSKKIGSLVTEMSEQGVFTEDTGDEETKISGPSADVEKPKPAPTNFKTDEPEIPADGEELPDDNMGNEMDALTDFEVGVGSIEPGLPQELNSTIVDLLNERIGDEYAAHYFYNCAANWCHEKGFENAGKFFDEESLHELQHAKKLQKFMVEWNVMPKVPQVDTQHEFKSLIEIINKAYSMEKDLFEKYDNNSRICSQIDLSAFDFLQWFREHQRESVKEFADLLGKAKLVDYTDNFQVLYFEQNSFGE